MKKRNILSLLLGAGLFFSMPACTNLDETVYDTIPSDNFGTTQEQINSIIAPVYKQLQNVWPGDFFCLITESGDMSVTPTRIGGDWWDGGYHMEMTRRTWTMMNNLVKNGWNNCMEGLSTCNMVYKIIENTEMDAALKDQTLKEIRGVRTYWMYMLVDNWGNAPIVKDFGDTELPSTMSRKEIFDFAVNELNEIKDGLRTDVTSTAAYGKFTKGTAYMLLAKFYLNAQEWVGTEMWQQCADACDVVMGLGYIIEPNWKTNFAVHNEVSKESIFEVPFSATLSDNHLHNRTLHYKDPIALGFTRGTWNGISAQPDYVKAFDDEDQRKEGSFLTGPMIDPATGKVIITDHGRELNHYVDISMFNQEKYDGIWGECQQEDGARCFKWTFEQGMNNTAMENDFHIFRLADTYLMKAEALVRMGKENTEATRLVNAIRERGFGNTSHNYATVDLEKIYKERKFELAWELFSRQDQIRFGEFGSATNYLRPEATPDFRKLFPIPYTAWQTNNKLVQNPGYPAFN